MIYVTSDLHLCHDKDFVYLPRGFSSVKDMSETIVHRWNAIIAPQDTVYLLGDVMLYDDDMGIEYLKSLNGNIYIICGNHDTLERQKKFVKCPNVMGVSYADCIRYGNYRFYMSHYPTITSNIKKDLNKVFNLHGHTHSPFKFNDVYPYMYNVSMDAHYCVPVSIVKIIEDIKEKWKS